MTQQINLAYETAQRCAVLTFPNGRQLKLTNVTEEQAKQFVERHGQEFARRDCILHTEPGIATRSGSDG